MNDVEALLRNFRSVADEQLTDVIMDDALASRIKNVCLSAKDITSVGFWHKNKKTVLSFASIAAAFVLIAAISLHGGLLQMGTKNAGTTELATDSSAMKFSPQEPKASAPQSEQKSFMAVEPEPTMQSTVTAESAQQSEALTADINQPDKDLGSAQQSEENRNAQFAITADAPSDDNIDANKQMTEEAIKQSEIITATTQAEAADETASAQAMSVEDSPIDAQLFEISSFDSYETAGAAFLQPGYLPQGVTLRAVYVDGKDVVGEYNGGVSIKYYADDYLQFTYAKTVKWTDGRSGKLVTTDGVAMLSFDAHGGQIVVSAFGVEADAQSDVIRIAQSMQW